jgi:hypothetical protein
MELPNQPDDDFDKDITGSFSPRTPNMVGAFEELHESFEAMRDAGFTEVQALRFLAFCSIYESDF